ILLHPGIPIGQLLLLTVDRTDEENEKSDILTGSYIGPIFPEAPIFKPLRKQLHKVGVIEPKIPMLPR
ncbi:MAG: hypothetical protein V4587_09500, partial [Acidobacteriota bacterium]